MTALQIFVNGQEVQLVSGDPSDSSPNLELRGSGSVELRFTEGDQTDPAGRFRIIASADGFSLERAASADWATATTLLKIDGTGLALFGETPVAQQSAIASLTDSTAGTADDTVQALTDPADAPVDADALREDLVANLIPELRNNYADLAAKVNGILAALRSVGIVAT